MPDEPDLAAEARAAWEANAAWWDERVGAEGNEFHRVLVAPAQLRLLALRQGERALDMACGNGQFAREMAGLGASVLAFDVAPTFVERAEQRTKEAGVEGIEYRVVDATDAQQLRALGTGDFDAAVCTMALMDMPALEPLLGALPELLRSDGRFVFSVQHPCFNSTGCQMVAEEEVREGRLEMTHAVKVRSYLDVPPQRGLGIVGQPEPHLYFHRPLSELLGTCFRAGFVLDGLEEPAYAEGATGGRPLGWHNYFQIPPVLVARVRPA